MTTAQLLGASAFFVGALILVAATGRIRLLSLPFIISSAITLFFAC